MKRTEEQICELLGVSPRGLRILAHAVAVGHCRKLVGSGRGAPPARARLQRDGHLNEIGVPNASGVEIVRKARKWGW